ncbi:hypothetical protein [Cryptosporangium sp. NPDC051539]|uniref:hypothetical protein n=1 Tax=Cryptosporangium sp. NPDC051539 TaxID=3363962 RepID=UPI0037AD9BC6
MYAVETDAETVEQVTALPTSALPSYAELMALLEVAPWSGESYNAMAEARRSTSSSKTDVA